LSFQGFGFIFADAFFDWFWRCIDDVFRFFPVFRIGTPKIIFGLSSEQPHHTVPVAGRPFQGSLFY
jgi:hypothetical protein